MRRLIRHLASSIARQYLVWAALGCSVGVVTAYAQARLEPDPPKVCEACAAWNAPIAPFRVFGNTYYVGPSGLTSILVTSPTGDVLLDGALPQSAALIVANIRALGFRPEDIKLIVTSHVHFDHVGGVAALQRLTGAPVATSAAAARALAGGNLMPDDPQAGLGAEATAFPPVSHLRVIQDGETLRAGTVAVTARFTPGHTPGGVTWTWESCEGARCLHVVYADSLTSVSADGFRFTGDRTHPSIVATFEHSLATVEALPCDVLLTTHPDMAHLADKLAARAKAPGTNPFIDAQACRALVESARADLDARIKREGAGGR